MRTEKVVEGKTELIVPNLGFYGKDSSFPSSEAPVFYNPVMEFSRTTSVCVLKGIEFKGDICDALAATGARGLRYANEVKGSKLTFFDWNKYGVSLIKRNLKNLGLNGEVMKGDSNSLLSGRHWTITDLDPFGTPVPFLDSIARSTEKFSMITATDTANLCGVYPKACYRLYGCKPFRSDFVHETGARIFLGKVAKAFAQHEKGIIPVLTQSSQHYFRLFLNVKRGAKKADSSLDKLGYILYCPKCRSRELSDTPNKKCECGSEYKAHGPLWAGKMFDKKTCKNFIKPSVEYGKQYEDFFRTIHQESDINAPYYNYHKLNSLIKKTPPKFDTFLEALNKKGYKTAKSHMDKEPTFRTDASIKSIKKILNSLS